MQAPRRSPQGQDLAAKSRKSRPSGQAVSSGRLPADPRRVINSAPAAIQPVISFAVAIPSGQFPSTSQNMPKYCTASRPRLQRQSRLSTKPTEVASIRTAASKETKGGIG